MAVNDVLSRERACHEVLRQSPTPTCIVEDGRISFINDACVTFLGGGSADQFVGRDPALFLQPELANELTACMRQLEQAGSSGSETIAGEVRRLDGSRAPASLRAARIPVDHAFSVSVELSGAAVLARMQESERRAQAEVDLITHKLPALVSYVNRDLRYVRVNARYADWLGISPDEMLGHTVQEVVEDHLGSGYWNRVRPYLEGALRGKPSSVQVTGKYVSGERTVEVHYTPDFDLEGRVQGVLVLVVDVTEGARANAELHFRATLLEEALEPMFVWRLPGPITYWNRAAEETYGYSSAEAIGRCSHELLNTQAAISMSDMEAALLNEGRWEGELGHVTKAGEHLIVASRLRRVDLPEGRFAIECTRDVTKRRAAEQELRELASTLEQRIQERTQELTRANDDLEAYAYSISHDLRAPLRTMQGFSDALLEDYGNVLDETGRHYAARIRAAAKRMDELIGDLLEYSRLGKAEIRESPIDLNQVVSDVLSQQQHQLKDANARMRVAADLGTVRANYGLLIHAIGNLISNAIKFVKPGCVPEIEIGSRPEGSRTRIWVKDNGIGIEPQHQGRIFRVFERLHGQETYPGTGVGLAIVKKAAERLGGGVGVDSTFGQGSCFWIELPTSGRRSVR